MIFYFSATGNSKYAAEKFASALNDKSVDLTECIKNNAFDFTLNESAPLGLVFPTYCFGLPILVIDFLERLNLRFDKKPYCFCAVTYGSSVGQAGRRANEILQDKNLSFNAYFSVKMPDTWTPLFDLSNIDKVQKILSRSEKEIDYAINLLKKQATGDFMRAKTPNFISKLYYKTYENKRKTSHLHVENTCIGCGKCVKDCPSAAIRINGKKPVWIKPRCTMCLSCLHHCPKFAIQYDNKTKNHGQYDRTDFNLTK